MLVALGAMLNFMNGNSETKNKLSTSLGDIRSSYAPADAKRMLNSSWSIQEKSSLEKTLNWLISEGGHNIVFLNEAQNIKQVPEAERNAYADSYMFTQIERWGAKWDDKGIIAWDICRASNVLQWSYAAGYISKEELLSMGKDVADLAIRNFSSWEELYDNYLDGYAWWSRSNTENGRPREDFWEALNGFYPDVFNDALLQ